MAKVPRPQRPRHHRRAIQGLQPGKDGQDGATFTPAVSADGTLSWTNDRSLPNPDPVNIRGPQGPWDHAARPAARAAGRTRPGRKRRRQRDLPHTAPAGFIDFLAGIAFSGQPACRVHGQPVAQPLHVQRIRRCRGVPRRFTILYDSMSGMEASLPRRERTAGLSPTKGWDFPQATSTPVRWT